VGKEILKVGEVCVRRPDCPSWIFENSRLSFAPLPRTPMITRRSALGCLVGSLAVSGFPRIARSGDASGAKSLVLVAGRPSHPPRTHEHNAGMLLLADCLRDVPGLEVTVAHGGWPGSNELIEKADAVVFFADGGKNHPAIIDGRADFLEKQIARGLGIGMMHFGVEVPAEVAGKRFLHWIGGFYEHAFSCNPIWTADVSPHPNHPIANGVRPFEIKDEWYFNMRFREDASSVTPILTAAPSDEVRDGPYVHPRGPYPHIQEAKGRAETLMWAVERKDGGRGFGFTGAHFHDNWGIDDFRKVILNALVWTAGLDVPAGGIQSSVTVEQLSANLDKK